MLIRHLPPDSRFVASVIASLTAPRPAEELTPAEQVKALQRSTMTLEATILADIYDQQVGQQWSNADPTSRGSRPEPHWRPGDVPELLDDDMVDMTSDLALAYQASLQPAP